MSDDVFLRIVVEEVGEVARAIHESEPDADLYKEITQIAAICASRMEGMRAQGRV
jgi:NTP pyrophosphatase (non-canonical NTP hydrolase)